MDDQKMQLSINTSALVVPEPAMFNHTTQNHSSIVVKDEFQNGCHYPLEPSVLRSKMFEDELGVLGQKIKHHEENIRFLKAQRNRLDESILDMQVSLGKFHSASSPAQANEDISHARSEAETIEQIKSHENSGAGILCQLRPQGSDLSLLKDVLGIVAILGKVNDDNLSRLLSEYLGAETMLAIVCRTFEGVKGLETYDRDGSINRSSGIHGFGATIGTHLSSRFIVICLQNLRPYPGGFIANDPQRRLDLLKPRLPNGESPPGFLGFAVNMVEIESRNLYCLTASGYGLRETLFYHLFSRLQVYRRRADMLQAIPCISDGALSLDGGIIKGSGVYYLGPRQEIHVTFPRCSGSSSLPEAYHPIEKNLKDEMWKKERLLEDMKREQALLDQVKFNFEIKKQDFVKFLAESSSFTSQQFQAGGDRLTPRW